MMTKKTIQSILLTFVAVFTFAIASFAVSDIPMFSASDIAAFGGDSGGGGGGGGGEGAGADGGGFGGDSDGGDGGCCGADDGDSNGGFGGDSDGGDGGCCGDGGETDPGDGPDGAGAPEVVVPTCDFKIDGKRSDQTIAVGETAVLSWTTTNTDSAVLRRNGDDVGTLRNNTGKNQTLAVGTYNYVLIAQKSGVTNARCALKLTVEAVVVTPPTPTPVIPVPGCTESGALNFNPNATENDGSCVYPVTPPTPPTPVIPVPGCTNSDALNFNPNATQNDGSCVFPVTPPVTNPECTLTPATQTITRGTSASLTLNGQNFTSARVDNGVNDVTKGVAFTVSPTADRTVYIATVTDDDGKNDTCSAEVLTTVVNSPLPECTSFTVSPATPLPVGGGPVILTWATANASKVTINNGAGQFINGETSTTVNVTADTVFTLTAENAAGVQDQTPCTVTVDVFDPTTPNTPDIGIIKREVADGTDNDSQTVSVGGTANFEIVVTNTGDEDLVNVVVTDPLETSCNHTIASLAVGESSTAFQCATANVTASFTNVASVTGESAVDGQTVTDSDPTEVVVPTVNSNIICESFVAAPDEVLESGSFMLTWDTTNADNVSIDRGVGSNLPADGDITVDAPSAAGTFRYVLTATASGENPVTCFVDVDVERRGGGGGGGSSRPRCEFEASDRTISAGEQITLSWETSRGRELTIFEGDEDDREIFQTDDDDDVDEGSIRVRPTEDTEYTLVVERGSRDRTCTVNIEVEGEEVVVLENRSQEPRVAGIALTQVPYTGFEAGPVLTFIFYLLLTLWALFVAYVFIMKNRSLAAGTTVSAEDEIYKKKLEMLSRKYQHQNYRW